jgi:hypothetical protein
LKDFLDNFLLGKVSNIESIDTLNEHTHPRIHSTPSSSFILNSLSSTLSNSYFSSRIFLLPTWISLSCINTSWAVSKAKTRSNNSPSSASKI